MEEGAQGAARGSAPTTGAPPRVGEARGAARGLARVVWNFCVASWMFANDYMRAWSNGQNKDGWLQGTAFASPMALRKNVSVSFLGVPGVEQQASVVAIRGGQVGRGKVPRMPGAATAPRARAVENLRLLVDNFRHSIYTAHGAASCLAGSDFAGNFYGTWNASDIVYEDSGAAQTFRCAVPGGEDRVITPPNLAVPSFVEGYLEHQNMCVPVPRWRIIKLGACIE